MDILTAIFDWIKTHPAVVFGIITTVILFRLAFGRRTCA